jgi:PAS domain S-box-containing protein
MPETQLDAIRRLIKNGEERLKKAAAENLQEKSLSPDEPAVVDTAPAPPPLNQTIPTDAALPATRERPAGGDAASPGVHASAQQLQFLHRKLKIVLESSRDAIISVNGNKKWTPANRRLREWLGYGEEEFSNVNFQSLFQPEVAAMLLDSFPRWLEGASPLRQVPGMLRGHGDVQIAVLISSHAGLDEQAEPFAYLMFEDTRPQRDLELQLERGRAFVDTIMREGTIPTIVMQKDGIIAQANRSACERLGIGSNEIPRMRLHDLVHPASREEFDGSFERAVQGQPPAEILCRFYRNNGVDCRGRIFLVGVANAQGIVERIIGMLDQVVVEPSSAWTAYGRMTPGVLSELSGFIANLIRDVLEQVRTKTKPDVKRLVNGVNGVRSVISRWMESAALIPEFPAPCPFGDVIRQVLEFRKAEFSRWGITAQFENTPAATEVCSWPPEIFHALLHVIQWCIEHLREESGARRVVIWAQKSGDNLEVSLLCHSAGITGSTNPFETGAAPEEPLRFKNLEYRAAQRLLDSFGATIVMENIGKTHQAIRISFNPSGFALVRKLSTQSRF